METELNKAREGEEERQYKEFLDMLNMENSPKTYRSQRSIQRQGIPSKVNTKGYENNLITNKNNTPPQQNKSAVSHELSIIAESKYTGPKISEKISTIFGGIN